MARRKRLAYHTKLVRTRERIREYRRKQNELKKATPVPASPSPPTVTELPTEVKGSVPIKNEPLDHGADAVEDCSRQQSPPLPSPQKKILTIKVKQNAPVSTQTPIKTEVDSRTTPPHPPPPTKMTIADRQYLYLQERRKRLLGKLSEEERTKFLEEEAKLVGPCPRTDEDKTFAVSALRTMLAQIELQKLNSEMTAEDLEAFKDSDEHREIPMGWGDLERMELEIQLLRRWRSGQNAKNKIKSVTKSVNEEFPNSGSESPQNKILTRKVKQNETAEVSESESTQVKTEVPKMTARERDYRQRRRKRLLGKLSEEERTKYLKEEAELGPGLEDEDEYRISLLRKRLAEIELQKLKSDLTPEDFEAFKIFKEQEATPKDDVDLDLEIKLLRKWRWKQRWKYKRLSDLSPEEREEARAKEREKKRNWYRNRKKRHLDHGREHTSVETTGNLKFRKLELDRENDEHKRLKRERYQQRVMRRIERRAQMTEEERELQRQKRYMWEVAHKSRLTKRETLERRKNRRLWFKKWFERKKQEGTYETYMAKEGRRKIDETPEKRERRLRTMRISAAKKSLRRKLEANGVSQEDIERLLEELAKNYKNVRALRTYKSRRKPNKPEELAETAEGNDNDDCSIQSGVSVGGEMTSSSSAVENECRGTFQLNQPTQPPPISPELIGFDDALSFNYDHSYEDNDNDNGAVEDEDDLATLASASQRNGHGSFNFVQSRLSPLTWSYEVPRVSNYPSRSSGSLKPEAYASTPSYSFSCFGEPDACAAFTNSITPAALPIQNTPSAGLPPPVPEAPVKTKRVGRPLGKPTNKSNIGRDCICDICGNVYTRQELLVHVRHVHHPYYRNGHCTVCSQRFKSAQFQVHFRTVHIPNGDIDLTALDERFIPRATGKHYPEGDHSVDKKRFTCDQCGQVYSQTALLHHKKKFHNPLYDPNSKKCLICGEELYGKFFYRHFPARHPEYVPVPTPTQRKRECERPHICHICGSKLFSSASLRRHISSVHRHDSENSEKFKCKFCPEEFSRKFEEYKHLREMHEDKCFHCLYCSSIRKTEIGILTHYALDCHHIPQEEKSRWVREEWDKQIDKMVVKCEICKTELQIVNLKRHYKDKHAIREGEHRCWECNKSFMVRAYLGVHLLEVHDLQPAEWLERLSKLNGEVKAVEESNDPFPKQRRGGRHIQRIAKGIRQKKLSREEKSIRNRINLNMRKMEISEIERKIPVKVKVEVVDEDGDLSELDPEVGESKRKRKSLRRGKSRPSYKECEDNDEMWEDIEDEVKPEVKKSYLSFVNDKKLNVMRSAVYLQRVHVPSLSSALGVRLVHSSDLKYIFV